MSLRQHAVLIWQAAVDAARRQDLLRQVLTDGPVAQALANAKRIVVVGAGKAGAAMAEGVESALPHLLDRITGMVAVPAESVRLLRSIRLHAARPAASNQPTGQGVVGAQGILRLICEAGADDVALCLISGGGSALLPAPVEGVSLDDKQRITQLLHASGATINEMNAVRKHLSRIKGGRLAEAFRGQALISLILSDVIGDPLDVIASGPTAPDPTTFADALAVLQGYQLIDQVPPAVLSHLQRGAAGQIGETPKHLPANVHNLILANNARSLAAAQLTAEQLGYGVLNLGSWIEGETLHVATALAGLVRSIQRDGQPLRAPACILSGGETTVTLAKDHGLGGRNVEFVLAAAGKLGALGLKGVVVLSGGTDGEDGPTDAAGAIADEQTLRAAAQAQLDPVVFLERNDAYHFFEATGDLLKTGLTETNVMDVRVILVTSVL
jgi:hydroxypyruvate reductase/glycerate 2-kinase